MISERQREILNFLNDFKYLRMQHLYVHMRNKYGCLKEQLTRMISQLITLGKVQVIGDYVLLYGRKINPDIITAFEVMMALTEGVYDTVYLGSAPFIIYFSLKRGNSIASRRMALSYTRNHFFRSYQQNEIGKLQKCNVLVVGPSRLIVECNGFDIEMRGKDISYTAFADLRDEYKTGQELMAKLTASDADKKTMRISIKDATPNPFYGADKRHPVGSTRKAIISGKYAGGLFCTMADRTTCMCLYSPIYFNEEFFNGDSVLITISQYDYNKKQIYGKIMAKM